MNLEQLLHKMGIKVETIEYDEAVTDSDIYFADIAVTEAVDMAEMCDENARKAWADVATRKGVLSTLLAKRGA